MSLSDKQIYEFGPFALDPAERVLRLAGAPVPLEPKAFDTLVVLVEHRGRLVEKEELLRQVWPGVFVEEVNLARNISVLRKALAQGFAQQPCIETVPKHGYRFVAAVTSAMPELVITQTTTSLTVEEELVIQDEGQDEDHDKGAYKLARQPRAPAWPRTAVLAGVLLLVALGAGLAFRLTLRLTQMPKSAPPIKSIAVLPFRPLDQASREPYLEIGMADTLITRLSALNAVAVRPTSAIRRYAEQEVDSLAAGRTLAVEAVLEGSLQRVGDRLRVTVRLLRVADGQSLWAHQCDTACTDIFQTQDTVSRQVAEALRPSLSPAEQQALTKRGTDDAEAYQLYLKGLYFFDKRTVENFEKALSHFNQALARDPRYAQAYVGRANVHLWVSERGAPKPAALAQYRAALQRALELDPALPEAHAALGLHAMNSDWDWAAAERAFKRAIELNPNYATARQWHGEFLAYMGRFDEALAEIKRAQTLDPLSLIISTDVGKVYTLARRYDEAIAQYQRTLELDPHFAEAHALLALTYSAKGLHEQAEREVQQIAELADVPHYLCFLGYVYGAAGKRAEARRVLQRLGELAQRGYVSAYFVTFVHAGLGDRDALFQGFEHVFAERTAGGAVSLKVNPLFDSFRSDPRFAELLRRAGFTP